MFRQGGGGAALQAVSLFVHSGQVLPAPVSEADVEIDPKPAQRLNRALAEKMLVGRTYGFLAAPAVGAGIPVTKIDLLALAAVLSGHHETAQGIADHMAASMARLGIAPAKDGMPVTDEAERHAVLRKEAEEFLSAKLALWRRLGVL